MIKKVLLLILLFPFLGYAQDISSQDIKPTQGDRTLEVQFAPLGDNPIGINGIRARWFKSETRAVRLNLFVGLDADTDIIQQEDQSLNLSELKARTTEIAISVRPGFENHIKVSERLSPYFGIEGDLTYQTFSEKIDQQNGGNVNYIKTTNNGRSGFFRLGANAVAGADFYVAKKLYVGTEFGFGFSYTSYLSAKVKSDIAGFTEPDPAKQGSSLDIGPNVLAQIRLGYAF